MEQSAYSATMPSFSAPFSNVFHFLKGVIPIAVEADKGRFVMPIDFFWVKLADGKATPFTDLTSRYVNVHLTESLLTPMAGYRLLDGEHLKIDALGGIRYWYIGQNLQLIGTALPVPAFVKSANWVDGLGGARFPKKRRLPCRVMPVPAEPISTTK